jgi:hypothetical protein
MDQLDVERLGGFAGFGTPGSHLRSLGQIDGSKLSPEDRQAVETLFTHPPPASAQKADGFRYKLTRQTDKGSQSVEVPEEHVPMAVRSSVKDELR